MDSASSFVNLRDLAPKPKKFQAQSSKLKRSSKLKATSSKRGLNILWQLFGAWNRGLEVLLSFEL
jgi:hypothetical protein